MEDILREAFGHNAWATKELLGAVRGLTQEQVTSPGTAAGTDRSILDCHHDRPRDRTARHPGLVLRRSHRTRRSASGRGVD